MNPCQCIKKNGLPCTRQGSKRLRYNNNLCFQHHKCSEETRVKKEKQQTNLNLVEKKTPIKEQKQLPLEVNEIKFYDPNEPYYEFSIFMAL